MFEFNFSQIDPTSPVFPLELFWFFMINGGVFIFIPLFLWGGFRIYMNVIQERFVRNTTYVLLAIDIPASAIPSIREAEHVFTHFAGMHRNPNWADKYIRGYVQPKVALEIVVIGGELQFIVRCAEMFRNLVEAAFYAQYPDAEITEVEDYAKEATLRFPNKEYGLWGADVIPVLDEAIPIKTHEDFEDKIQGKYADPLKSLLETLAILPPGEQVWLQINLLPIDQNVWRTRSLNYAKKLAGISTKSKPTFLSNVFDFFGARLEDLINAIGGWEGRVNGGENGGDDQYSLMMHLTPGEKDVIEAVQKKAEKVGFNTLMRFIYMGPKTTFNKGLGVSAIFGYFNQFAGLNGLKPEGATKTQKDYALKDARLAWSQNRLLRYYKSREMNTLTGLGTVMNVAEIASLFHFPNTEEERLPANVSASQGRKGEAPGGLPFDELESVLEAENPPIPGEPTAAAGPPTNLPFVK